MSCEIIIRRARPEDWLARTELVKSVMTTHQRDAFFLFFFQELTLQASVLSAAVLFIFCGVSLRGLCLVVPSAAIAVGLAVFFAHLTLATKQAQDIRKEMVGFVAELRGPLLAEPQKLTSSIVFEQELQGTSNKLVNTQVVGTVSLSEYRGDGCSGWLHALAVHPQWWRRGVGRALARASRTYAAAEGLQSLEAIASELQPAALALLRAAGWESRGWYHRRLCGAALTLLLSHFSMDLAYA
ncbi:uncharacterized protein LOC131841272 [Achroia grisella]|uniref:uncharacterized protein LOC131841272 n=1 Tax=Achroia grisella TaxID=688607 RepID=UPI0027D29C9F|nr:uncharacterized protein LOC131841272 [Achroia grisella]